MEFIVWNGDYASIIEYSHTCFIRYAESSLRCGGSLISDRWVLTAATCNIELATEVVLGTDELSPNTNYPGKIFSIEERIIHANYSKVSKHNDIALIKLKETVQFSDEIYPACLFSNVNGQSNGDNLIVTGFIKNGSLLLQGILQVSPASHCLEVISSQICANGLKANKDACAIDAGSSLQIKLSQTKDISSVVGIVSLGCGTNNVDGVYTRVASYLDWIEGHVWPGDV